MTDHQQAALTATQDEIYRQLNYQYGDFNTPSNEEVKAILAAAEPHLRRKWAEEVRKRLPDLLCAEEDDLDGIATSHDVLYLDDAASSIDLHQNIAAIAAKIVEGADHA